MVSTDRVPQQERKNGQGRGKKKREKTSRECQQKAGQQPETTQGTAKEAAPIFPAMRRLNHHDPRQ